MLCVWAQLRFKELAMRSCYKISDNERLEKESDNPMRTWIAVYTKIHAAGAHKWCILMD